MKKFLTMMAMMLAIATTSMAQSGSVILTDLGDVYNCGGFKIGISVYPLPDGHYAGLYAIDYKNPGACDTCWTHKWDRGFPGTTIPTPAQLYQTWCPAPIFDQTYSLFSNINPKGGMIRIRQHKEYIDLIGPAAELVWNTDRWNEDEWLPWSNTVTLGASKKKGRK